MTAVRACALLLLALLAAPAAAQESRLHSDLRRESEDLKKSCGDGFDLKKLFGCVVTVATDDPVHLAVGSLPPLNGTGFGLAFVEHFTPNEHWRISWDADGVVSTSSSWRAGAYMKLIHIPDRPGITVVRPGMAAPTRPPSVTIAEYPVWNVYAQTISLDTLTTTAGQREFSERQTIIGTDAIFPLTSFAAIRGLRPSLIGAVNGRFLNIQGDALTPSSQPSFAQFEEGIRLKPSMFDDYLRLNYLVDFQQFAAAADSHRSFHRWTLDLKHEVPLYRTVSSSGPKDTNGPDECFQSVGLAGCPPVS